MDLRAQTAFPSLRRDHRLTLTDVTSPFRKLYESDIRQKAYFSRKPFTGGSAVPRPFTTPHSRRSTSESPPNFSWIDQGWLAGCSTPSDPKHHRFLFENGIRHVVSLMKERPAGAMESVQLPKLNRLKIRIDDFCAPTLNQIRQFIKIVEDANDRKEAVAVHCANGNGRTGTMLACYLIKQKHINASNALQEIRKLRPGSVESPEQEKAIEQFYHYLRISR
uniref:Dual specificity protein phosphatase 23 n=1 Tax=Phallusia mammillata TaxID=59560 RepID=A0A6F9DC90_9ASCI|nr:dual specificity protein phosphatase 23-like [Phallusia mammillata]